MGDPTTVVLDDPNDLEPLSPSHLLMLRAGGDLGSISLDKSDLYSRKRWRQVQYHANVFWRRWNREYLPSLQHPSKLARRQTNVKIGDVVLAVDETIPRNTWLVGRIIEAYMGKDQLVWSAKVKTKSRTLVRPTTKLCLLESV